MPPFVEAGRALSVKERLGTFYPLVEGAEACDGGRSAESPSRSTPASEVGWAIPYNEIIGAMRPDAVTTTRTDWRTTMDDRSGKPLAGKTLLMLGGYPLMNLAIDKAHELGARVVVTDWIHDSPAKRNADEAYDVSTTDVDALEDLARSCNVDGVFLGVVDINLVPGAELCSRLGLPCYATAEQFRKTLDKIEYKKLCEKYGIPCVDTYGAGLEVDNLDELEYPVIIKPADSYSSKGIKVCRNAIDASLAVQAAKKVSPQDKVIIEPFVTGDDVYLYFTVQGGVLSLSAMADRFVNDPTSERGFAPQPMLYMFPSRYIDLYYEQAHDAIQRMITGEGIENASFMMQGFVIDGRISFFEMGLRLTGGAGYISIRHQNKIDQLEMHVRYALGEGFGPWLVQECDNPRFDRPACVMVPLLRNGVIARIEGLEDVKALPTFVDIIQLHEEGDVMSGEGTLNEAFARIYFCADDDDQLLETIRYVKSRLDILDENGTSLLFPWFSDDDLTRYLEIRKNACER